MPRRKLQNYVHQEFQLIIDGLSTRGWGQGIFVDGDKSIDVEVRGALPGDVVKVEGRHIENNMVQGRILEFLHQHYPRIEMRCPHAGPRTCKDNGCGGCTLKDCDYGTQCRLKEDCLREALKSRGIEMPVQPIIPCSSVEGYRNKMELSFGPDGASEIGCGLHPAGFKHEIITMQYCDMLSPVLPEIAQKATAWAKSQGIPAYNYRMNEGFLRLLTMRQGKRTGQTMVILTTSGVETVQLENGQRVGSREIVDGFRAQVLEGLSEHVDTFYWTRVQPEKGRQTIIEDELIFGQSVLTEEMYLPDKDSSLKFEILPRAFFQPNTLQAEKLYRVVLEQAAPFMHGDTPMLDLYCGTGTIGLSFARHGHRVVAIDIEKQAIENARQNAILNGLEDKIAFYAGDSAVILKEMMDKGEDLKGYLVVIDPPRRGLLPPAFRQIMRISPQTLIYVSCNPLTLADDLKLFRENGYEIRNIQPVDMLPQTAHLETVATLCRAE